MQEKIFGVFEWVSDNKVWSIIKNKKNNEYELRKNNNIMVIYNENKNIMPSFNYDIKVPTYVYKRVCEVIWEEK